MIDGILAGFVKGFVRISVFRKVTAVGSIFDRRVATRNAPSDMLARSFGNWRSDLTFANSFALKTIGGAVN
ncbi:MAG: hypothetical protein IPM25_00655 [Chloracidobacterium sp.]|nr:hypothetical protein [Chloracidobacterium sp.]